MENKGSDEKVRIVRYYALTLRKKLGDTNDTAALSWSMRGIYPRCNIYTSNKAFTDGKPNYDFIITAPFDIITLEMVLVHLEEIIEAENGAKFTIDCLNNKIENKERKSELFLQARMTIGKDDNGIIYIAVTEEGKKKIKFDLVPTTPYFKYYNKSGEQIKDESILSKYYAKGYLRNLREFLYNDIVRIAVNATMVDNPNIKRNNRNSKKENTEKKSDDFEDLF